MSDLDNLRFDSFNDHNSTPVIESTAYYINPSNPLDISTPGGRELLDEIYPSSSSKDEGGKDTPFLMLCIAALILFVFLS